MILTFGETIVEKREEKDVYSLNKYSLKRDEKVKSLPMKTSVKFSDKDDANIDCYLLFLRSKNSSDISSDGCKRHQL